MRYTMRIFRRRQTHPIPVATYHRETLAEFEELQAFYHGDEMLWYRIIDNETGKTC